MVSSTGQGLRLNDSGFMYTGQGQRLNDSGFMYGTGSEVK